MRSLCKRGVSTGIFLELGAEHKWLKYLSETIGNNQDNVPRTVFENTHYGERIWTIEKYDKF